MRSAFGLIQALIVIVIISGLLVIAMKYAKITTKQTADLYVKERAELFMDEAVEMTLLAISGFDRSSGDCLKTLSIDSEDKRFIASVNVAKYYLYNGLDNNGSALSSCDRVVSINTEDSHGMVELEVIVNTNSNNAKNKDKFIRLTRRTLQRP